MRNGKAVIFLGCCLIILIFFTALIEPSLNAYTETTTTQTTTIYFGPSDFSLESVEFSGTPYVTETCSVYYPSGTSYITIQVGTLPTCVESIIYSTQIISGVPFTTIVSIIYRSGYYIPPSSVPASSVPFWMIGLYSSSNVLSSIPKSTNIFSVSSSKSSLQAKPSIKSVPSQPLASSSKIESVASPIENFTDSEVAATPNTSTHSSYWWTLSIAVVLILGAFLFLYKNPKKNNSGF